MMDTGNEGNIAVLSGFVVVVALWHCAGEKTVGLVTV